MDTSSARLKELWPRWKPTRGQADLWDMKAKGLDRSTLASAIDEQRCTTKWGEPRFDQIMARYVRMIGPKPSAQQRVERREAEDYAELDRLVASDTAAELTYLGDLPAYRVDRVIPRLDRICARQSGPYPTWTTLRRRMLALMCVSEYRDDPPADDGEQARWFRHMVQMIELVERESPPPKPPTLAVSRVDDRPESEATQASQRVIPALSRGVKYKNMPIEHYRRDTAAQPSAASDDLGSIRSMVEDVIEAGTRGSLPDWMVTDD